MPTLQISEDQIIELFEQLPGESQFKVLLKLTEGARAQREARMKYAESQLRQLCQERGLNWDTLSEDEREQFIVDLIHEDRACTR